MGEGGSCQGAIVKLLPGDIAVPHPNFVGGGVSDRLPCDGDQADGGGGRQHGRGGTLGLR